MTSGPHIPQERSLVTAIPGPKSQEMLVRRSEAASTSLGMAIPVFVAKAGGGVIIDIDGNSIIDMAAGIATVNVGNSADRVVKNVMEQVQAFTHTCFTVAPYSGYVEVCEALNRLTPGSFKKKSVLVNSGAEAVENAVKIARAFTKRPAVVVFEHAYHGRTNLTMALTAKNMPIRLKRKLARIMWRQLLSSQFKVKVVLLFHLLVSFQVWLRMQKPMEFSSVLMRYKPASVVLAISSQ